VNKSGLSPSPLPISQVSWYAHTENERNTGYYAQHLYYDQIQNRCSVCRHRLGPLNTAQRVRLNVTSAIDETVLKLHSTHCDLLAASCEKITARSKACNW